MNTKKILLVEDEVIIAMNIKAILENYGFIDVNMVHSGEAAIDFINENIPDLILMDIILGSGIDGIKTITKIKKDYNIPVVYLTAHSDMSTFKKAQTTEPFGYIIKPIKDVELITTIEIALYKVKIQDQLKEKEERFKMIIDHSNEVFYIHGTDHKISYISETSTEILGYSPEEMMRKWTDLSTENPINLLGIQHTEKAIKTGKRQAPYLVEIQKKDHSIITVEVNESPVLDEDGNVTGIVGALRDITEKQSLQNELAQNEFFYKTLMENLDIGIFMSTISGKFIHANKRVAEMGAYNSPEEFKEQAAQNLYVNIEDREKLISLLKKNNSIKNMPLKSKKKNGDTYWISISVSLTRNRNNEPTHLIGFVEEIEEPSKTC